MKGGQGIGNYYNDYIGEGVPTIGGYKFRGLYKDYSIWGTPIWGNYNTTCL